MKSIGFYLTGYKGLKVLEEAANRHVIKFVVAYGDFYEEIKNFCNLMNISIYNSNKVLSDLDADKIFFIGWQYLVEPQDNFVVLHDSRLPKYIGFCPTVTALINGDTKLGVTAFRPTKELDSGPVYGKLTEQIPDSIKIKEALEIVSRLSCKLIREIIEHNIEPYDDSEGGFYSRRSIWRDSQDYFVNWNKPPQYIKYFVNAVGYPYEGAKTWAPHLITIHEVEPVHLHIDDPFYEHTGKIWSLDNDEPIVVCRDGAIKIKKYDGLRITKLRTKLGCKQ